MTVNVLGGGLDSANAGATAIAQPAMKTDRANMDDFM
jgi:hypothetical protein